MLNYDKLLILKDHLYVGDKGILEIYSLSDPENPKKVGELKEKFYAFSGEDQNLYLIDEGALKIFQIEKSLSL